jgi:general secretion pathway protein G
MDATLSRPDVPEGRITLRPRRQPLGWTLVEMVLVIAIIGTLTTIAIPSYEQYTERAKVARAEGDIEAIQADLAGSQFLGKLPATLAEIGRGDMVDPWGHPYQYLRFPLSGETPSGARKDRFLVPINSTYDLYSMGPDGITAAPLTSSASHDDIIRANDGAYIGPASAF